MTRETSKSEIAECLLRAGIPDPSLFLGDDFYALPTEDWVQNGFARQWEAIALQLGIRYQSEKQDCEDFAMLAAAVAKRFHAETSDAPEAGLAFGELWIGAREHALNLVIHQNEQGKLYVQPYEPQLGWRGWSFDKIKLSPADFKSVVLAKL